MMKTKSRFARAQTNTDANVSQFVTTHQQVSVCFSRRSVFKEDMTTLANHDNSIMFHVNAEAESLSHLPQQACVFHFWGTSPLPKCSVSSAWRFLKCFSWSQAKKKKKGSMGPRVQGFIFTMGRVPRPVHWKHLSHNIPQTWREQIHSIFSQIRFPSLINWRSSLHCCQGERHVWNGFSIWQRDCSFFYIMTPCGPAAPWTWQTPSVSPLLPPVTVGLYATWWATVMSCRFPAVHNHWIQLWVFQPDRK